MLIDIGYILSAHETKEWLCY